MYTAATDLSRPRGWKPLFRRGELRRLSGQATPEGGDVGLAGVGGAGTPKRGWNMVKAMWKWRVLTKIMWFIENGRIVFFCRLRFWNPRHPQIMGWKMIFVVGNYYEVVWQPMVQAMFWYWTSTWGGLKSPSTAAGEEAADFSRSWQLEEGLQSPPETQTDMGHVQFPLSFQPTPWISSWPVRDSDLACPAHPAPSTNRNWLWHRHFFGWWQTCQKTNMTMEHVDVFVFLYIMRIFLLP
jgi:hypothetical protein